MNRPAIILDLETHDWAMSEPNTGTVRSGKAVSDAVAANDAATHRALTGEIQSRDSSFGMRRHFSGKPF